VAWLIALIGVVAGLIAKDVIASVAVTQGIKAITGLNARIASMQVGLRNTTVGIKGLQVLNPPGFTEAVMVDIPELYIDYELSSFLKGKAHLETLRLNLQELTVVRGADGRLNLRAIKAIESDKPKKATEPPQAGKATGFQIDVLELRIGTVVFKDYSQSPPLEREFRVNVEERYEHITDPYAFAGLVVSRALVKTTVGQLANFDVAGLQRAAVEALKRSANYLTGTLREGVESSGQLGTEAVNEAAGAFKKLFER
jgi:hypothetical protein